MKIFPAQIYCLFLFYYYSVRDHGNENISSANLLLVPFGFDSKKCLMLCISIMLLFLYKYFDVAYKFKISRPKYLFLWCLFLTIKKVQKRGIWKGRDFFSMRFIWSVLELSILHYYLLTQFSFLPFLLVLFFILYLFFISAILQHLYQLLA